MGYVVMTLMILEVEDVFNLLILCRWMKWEDDMMVLVGSRVVLKVLVVLIRLARLNLKVPRHE
mgnify:FL=1